MKLRTLSIFAAVALLAACESTPQNAGAGAGTGQAAPPAAPAAVGVVPGSAEDFIKNVGDRVFFDYNKSSIAADAKATLDKQIAWLKTYPAYSVTVEGHADERGTREYNLALGERRANAVKQYLSGNGIAAARLKTVSYGKERPVCVSSDETCWSQNRRAVSVLSK